MSAATVTKPAHFGWCDPASCYQDETCFDEPGMVHLSGERRWLDGGEAASVRVLRFRADWSEDVAEAVLVVDWPASLTLTQAREFAYWLADTSRDLIEQTTAAPPATTCPPWCSASDSPDLAVRRAHQWTFSGMAAGTPGYIRRHHGIIGRSWREQYEHSDRDGHVELGRITARGRVRD